MIELIDARSGVAHKVAMVLWISLLAAGCSGPHKNTYTHQMNEVVVMGMIHGEHRTSSAYGIQQVQDFVRRIDPDYILCEIPPDRLETALSEFRQTGTVTEPRVRVFPEYVDAIFPLTSEMDFGLIPCAAWTRAMADDRRTKLTEWETTRPAESAEVERAEQEADQRLEALGLAEDPIKIHTAAYDAIVKKGLEPYNRLFNDDLGLGGWDNINAGHYALISRALDRHTGEGRRFLITFGAWHKYWFLEQLRQRGDIVLLSLGDFIQD